MFPSVAPADAISRANGHARTNGELVPAGLTSRRVRGFLWHLFDLPQADRTDSEDEDIEPSDWPKAELVVRQKAPAPTG
jgi:hypothetical protein